MATIHDIMKRSLNTTRLQEELAKCVCLCVYCHRKVHSGTLILLIDPEID